MRTTSIFFIFCKHEKNIHTVKSLLLLQQIRVQWKTCEHVFHVIFLIFSTKSFMTVHTPPTTSMLLGTKVVYKKNVDGKCDGETETT